MVNIIEDQRLLSTLSPNWAWETFLIILFYCDTSHVSFESTFIWSLANHLSFEEEYVSVPDKISLLVLSHTSSSCKIYQINSSCPVSMDQPESAPRLGKRTGALKCLCGSRHLMWLNALLLGGDQKGSSCYVLNQHWDVCFPKVSLMSFTTYISLLCLWLWLQYFPISVCTL